MSNTNLRLGIMSEFSFYYEAQGDWRAKPKTVWIHNVNRTFTWQTKSFKLNFKHRMHIKSRAVGCVGSQSCIFHNATLTHFMQIASRLLRWWKSKDAISKEIDGNFDWKKENELNDFPEESFTKMLPSIQFGASQHIVRTSFVTNDTFRFYNLSNWMEKKWSWYHVNSVHFIASSVAFFILGKMFSG